MTMTPEESAAIEKFALNVTIPILLDTANGVTLLATGTLFEVAGSHFIVTARHIFDSVRDLAALAFPERSMKGNLHTFGNFQLAKPTEEHVDVAILELKEPDVENHVKLSQRYHLKLSHPNIA